MTPHAFIEALCPPLTPLRDVLRAATDLKALEGSVVALHDSSVAPEYYGIEVWFPLKLEQVRGYAERMGFAVPDPHAELLTQANGIHLKRLSVYGIPPSMLANPPLLDRTRRQPLDIRAAILFGRHAYKGQQHRFQIGALEWSGTEIAGLFLQDSGVISAVLKPGQVVGEWAGYEALLRSEASRSAPGV